jgi:hypothetical protein
VLGFRVFCATLIGAFLPGALWCTELTTSTSWEAGELPAVRLGISASDMRFSLLEYGQGRTMAGLTTPWLRFGPLTPSGLLREAANPLGFGAGSPVFLEATGLRLDLSLPGSPAGFLCAPVPGSLGFFSIPFASGGEEYGCFIRAAAPSGTAVESLLILSRPPAGASGDEWYLAHAPYPGGALLDAAARFTRADPAVSLAMTMGASAGERVAPDLFVHLLFTGEGDGIDLGLLFGAAGPGYRTPRGDVSAEAALVSGAVALRGDGLTVDATYDYAVGRVGFTPGAALPTRQTIGLSVSRRYPATGKNPTRLELAGKKIISWDERARREESARCSASVRARMGRVDLQAGMECSEDGLGISLTADTKPGLHFSAGLDAGFYGVESTDRRASLVANLRWSLAGGALTVKAGVEHWPLLSAPPDPGDCLTCTLSWSARSWVEDP